MTTLPDNARAALDTLDRDLGLAVVDVLRQTTKSLLVAGTLAERPVVAKVVLDDDPFWIGKLGHEIAVYQIFAHNEPPIRVPRMIHADDARLLVLERLDGRPLDSDRYPNRILPDAAVDAAIDAWSAEWEVNHGDLLPSNVLLSPNTERCCWTGNSPTSFCLASTLR